MSDEKHSLSTMDSDNSPRLPRTQKKDDKTQKNQKLTMSLELDTIK